MNKLKFFLIGMLLISTANAGSYNPMMGDYQNQVAFNFGQGIDSGFLVPPPFRWVPFHMLHIQYSQPTTFFRLPARQSLNVAQTIGSGTKYRWHWDKYTIPIMYASQDVALLYGRRWYYATGLAVGFQAQQNERISSKLLFGYKMFAGYRFTDSFGAELFMQHFSNGNTTHDNHSYAFYGLGLTYSF